jgi:hypothetical protein
MHRGVRTPPRARLHPIALIEDEESIQAALMEVINALMRNTIDLKRAALILRALHIAVKNASRVKFNVNTSEMVKDIPDYADDDRVVAEEIARVGTAVPEELALSDPRNEGSRMDPDGAEVSLRSESVQTPRKQPTGVKSATNSNVKSATMRKTKEGKAAAR